jgi:aminomethyltransferase
MLVALYSPRLEMNIGYAMVATEYSNLDTSVNVETPVGTLAAKVVEMPFVKPIKSQA